MRKLVAIIVFALMISAGQTWAQCCATTASAKEKTACVTAKNAESPVKVYYFHASRRCDTCVAVEKVTKEAVQEYFGDIKSFQSVNREKEADLVKKFKVSGQTLLVVSGDKQVNLTSLAFLNARMHPDKLKKKIKSTISSME
ncbi:hypothetical protein FUAX_40610 (plasmid) [Fulvitalea axinellae]|uniref:Thioredoxin domain-containing protein n=1 Tax=Fulvitalea axinellae TaxID=1182444 RepID=A0AAU9DAQ2_9BACT|nr:hypothetical protein FUAX_40610 [Fulvitalea axinellae]